MRKLIWRETTQVYAHDNSVYQKFFETVRAANRKLPDGRKVRVLMGEPPIDWSKVNNFNDRVRE